MFIVEQTDITKINFYSLQYQLKMDPMFSMSTLNCIQRRLDRNLHKCKIDRRFQKCFLLTQNFSPTSDLRTYPVYAVGDYAGGQQYYATTASSFAASSSSSNGNANGNSYIVPVDETILGVNPSRGSPQTISSVSC